MDKYIAEQLLWGHNRGIRMEKIGADIRAIPWIVFARVFFGLFWLYEITIGHNWKVGHEGWVGAGAGDWLAADIIKAINAGTWGWAEWFLTTLIMPYVEFFSYAVLGLQLLIAISLIFGIFVRPVAIVGLAHTFVMLMTGHSRVPPFFSIGFLLILAFDAGMYYGLDAILVRKLKQAGGSIANFIRWVIQVPFPDWIKLYVALPVLILSTSYFALDMVINESTKFRMASLDLILILGLSAVGLALLKKTKLIPLTARLLGIFVGYRFLHEMLIRKTPALNGLPGWDSAATLVKPFEDVVANGYAPMAWVATNIFIPYSQTWLYAFGVVQLAVGAMLILGYKTRVAGFVGIGYLSLLLLMGFARYVPFMLGLLVISWALNNGKVLSLDGLIGKEKSIRVPHFSVQALFIATIVLIGTTYLAVTGGITPDSYKTLIGENTAAMIAMIALPLVIAGAIQTQRELKKQLRKIQG